MDYKILFVILTQVYMLESSMLKCTPQPLPQTELHDQWTRESHKSCLPASAMMLPSMKALNAYRNQRIERSKCHNEDCDPRTDYLCAHCMDDSTLPNGCVAPDENSGIERRSACSWHYQNNSDRLRYPIKLREAVCHLCDCSKDMDNEDPNLYTCQTVYHSVPVLYAVNRAYKAGETCEYEFKYQELSVGCTCARLAIKKGSHIHINREKHVKINMKPQENKSEIKKTGKKPKTGKPQPKKCLSFKKMKSLCVKGYKKPFSKKVKGEHKKCMRKQKKQNKNCLSAQKKRG